MRVMFFGTAAFAVPSVEQLVAGRHPVVICVTQPDRPRGRGLTREPSPIKRAALRLGLPVAQPERLTAELFDALRPDVGVVAAYGQMIPGDLLRLPIHGMVGVHPSLLPKYRGAAPVAWAILNGERTTGVTLFRLNEGLDAGDVISQQAVPIEARESAEELTNRLAVIGARELLRSLEAIAAGRARFTPQAASEASLAPKLTKAQGRIVWNESAERIERLVRATVSWPGASTTWRGGVLRVWSASLGEPSMKTPAAAPGTIVQVTPDAIVVATGHGTLVIHEVQPAGKRRMSMREFLAGHPLRPGDILGVESGK